MRENTLIASQPPPAAVHAPRAFWRRHGAPLALLVVVIGLFHWPVLSRSYTFVDNSPDLTNMEIPDMELRAHALRQGIVPIWDPYSQGGRPMLGQLNPHLFDPFSTAYLLIPLKQGHLNLRFFDDYLVLLRCFAGVAAYLLLAELGLLPIACMFGAFLYAVSGVTGTTAWPETIGETIYPPLVFLFLFRSLSGRKPLFNAGAAGAVTGLSWFSGTHHIPLIASFSAILTLVAAVLIERRWRPGIGRIAVYCGIAGCIGAPQILPSLEFAPLATRWVGLADPIQGSSRVPFLSHLNATVQPENLLGILIPGNLGLPADNGMSFLGIVAIVFIAIAAGEWVSSRLIRYLAVVALTGALLPLAEYNHLYGLLYTFVPAMEKLREPGYWFFLLQAAGSCLAAIGLHRYLHRREVSRRFQSYSIRSLLIFGGVVFTGAALWGTGGDASRLAMVHQYSMAGIVALLLGGLLAADAKRFMKPAVLGGLLIVLVFIEHGYVSGHTSQANMVPAGPRTVSHLVQPLREHRELGEFLKHRPDVLRIESDPADIPEALGDFHLIEDMSGHEGTALTQFFHLWPWTYRAQQLYSANYYVSRKPFDPRQILVYTSPSTGLNVYRNPGVQPRTWVVHRLESSPDSRMEELLNNPNFDIATSAFLSGKLPGLETCAGTEDARLLSRSWFRSTVEATLNCRGMVILNDHAYPGWSAQVDGAGARIYPAYGALRGVVVDAGRHRIEFRYRPWSLIAGGALFAIGALVLAGIGWKDRNAPEGSCLLTGAEILP